MKERMEELTEQLNAWNRAYYEEDRPVVSDAEYDRAMRELEDLEERHPQWKRPDSPTLRVGGKAVEGFAPVTHRRPLLSLANTFSAAELADFERRLRKDGVEDHINIIFSKLGASNRAEAVAIALRKHLLKM